MFLIMDSALNIFLKLRWLFDAWLLLSRIMSRSPRMILPFAPPPPVPLGVTVLLYPRWNIGIGNGSGGWTGTDYEFNFILQYTTGTDTGFIHVNELENEWLSGNNMAYAEYNGTLFLASPVGTQAFYTGNMSMDPLALYLIKPAVTADGTLFIFSDTTVFPNAVVADRMPSS